MMRQPHFHAPQHIQQKSHAFSDMIAGFAQSRIAYSVNQAFGLRQRFSGMRHNVLLLVGVGATQPQIDYTGQFRARERFPACRIEHFALVALRQPYDLPRRGGRQ